jgi:hypothetical protein
VHEDTLDQIGNLTREERLMEREQVRAHHKALYLDYLNDTPGGVQAWRDHAEAHREAAYRLKLRRVTK